MDNKAGLYPHNIDGCEEIRNKYNSGEKIVATKRATGTGKGFIGLEMCYEKRDKKTIYVVPSLSIIEHLERVIADNPNLDRVRDLPNLEFRTYASFVNMSEEEIASLDCDFIVLDEFHHLGAPVWGSRINTLIETHPNAEVLGLTAYTVRDRGTVYERDMALQDGDEIFSDKLVANYDLCDAMIDGVLPKPIYKTAYINLMKTAEEIEELLDKKYDHNSKGYRELEGLISDAKRRILEAPSIPKLLQDNLKNDGKYIYFCPPISEDGTNDIDTIKRQFVESLNGKYREEDIIIYTSTSKMGYEGKRQREAFYRDVDLNGEKASGKLRVMFAINQYNEGVHTPNIDGVIMGRGTGSDIVYFEQLGRALAVRGNNREKVEALDKFSIEELRTVCRQRAISYDENTSKEEIINKLLSPLILDLTNNYEFIKELENNLGTRVKEVKESNSQGKKRRKIMIDNVSFDIEVFNKDLYETLKYTFDRLNLTWDDKYEMAKAYYEHYGNLLVNWKFKTNNGYEYDENGIFKLGKWISNQRRLLKFNETDAPEQRKDKENKRARLEQIGMVWDGRKALYDEKWEIMYREAKKYYEKNGHLLVPSVYKQNGKCLGEWITDQRAKLKFNENDTPEQRKDKENKRKKLEIIGMVWDGKKALYDEKWEAMYQEAEKYYEKNGHLLVPSDYENNGKKLGGWIKGQRRYLRLEDNDTPEQRKDKENKRKRLELIGMVWDGKKALNDEKWEVMYQEAKKYYEKNGHLLGPYDDEENGKRLRNWIMQQRISLQLNDDDTPEQKKDKENKRKRLELIGMVWDGKKALNDEKWEVMYQEAKKYYEKNGDLMVSRGYEENGKRLGNWISKQRTSLQPNDDDTPEQKKDKENKRKRLELIGMVWDVKKNREEVKDVCTKYGINVKKNSKIIKNISLKEFKSKIEYLNVQGIPYVTNGVLHEIFNMSSRDIEKKYGVNLAFIITNFYVDDKGKGLD